jgi:hypothetical protein
LIRLGLLDESFRRTILETASISLLLLPWAGADSRQFFASDSIVVDSQELAILSLMFED